MGSCVPNYTASDPIFIILIVTDIATSGLMWFYFCLQICLQFLLNFISGVPVRMKKSPFLMHHKFLVIDKNILINGSSNWTSTSFAGNWDNIIVTSVPALVMPFSRHFSQLWTEFSEMDHKLQVW